MGELLLLAKETLGIVDSATAKDKILLTIIKSCIEDMKRAGIKVDLKNALIQNTIMVYVRANFGISNPNEKAKYNEIYQMHLTKLSLSSEYKEAQNGWCGVLFDKK